MNALHQCHFEKLKVGHTCLRWIFVLLALTCVSCIVLAGLAAHEHIPKKYVDTFTVAFCLTAIVTLAVYLFYERVTSVFRERYENRQECGLPV